MQVRLPRAREGRATVVGLGYTVATVSPANEVGYGSVLAYTGTARAQLGQADRLPGYPGRVLGYGGYVGGEGSAGASA